MISRTASKLVCSNGRSGKTFSVAALASSANKNENENEIAKGNGSDDKLKGKKISKAQRRAMVEIFVKKYRAMNDGKLPYASHVVKEVGGSYYVVKKIVQELEHHLNLSTSNQKASGKEAVKEYGPLSKAKEVSTSEISLDSSIQSDTQVVFNNCVDISGKDIIAEEGSQSCSSAEKTFSKQDVYSEFTVEQSSQGDEENIFHSGHEKPDMDKTDDNASDSSMPTDLPQEKFNNKQKETWAEGLDSMVETKQKEAVSDDLRDKDGAKDKTGQHEETPKHKHSVDTSSQQTSKAEAETKSTLWGNLKLFADGIMKIWRKS